MRLTDQEKYVIHRLLACDPLAGEALWYSVRGGIYEHEATKEHWRRAVHLERIKNRLERWRLCRRIRDANAATQRAEAHGYRPEFV
jgi:hypothetical protein